MQNRLHILPLLTLFAIASACRNTPQLEIQQKQRGGVDHFYWDNTDRPADILFVIDNSESMAGEQDLLVRSISSTLASSEASLCDALGFARLQRYAEANPKLADTEWEQEYQDILAECGFFEQLQIYQNRFHIGVITTDMNDCDRPNGRAWRSSVPQQGCLQTSQQDPNLTVLTWETPDVANKFANIVHNIGTWGSPYEQGLRSSENFLTPMHNCAISSQCALQRDCHEDYDNFLRNKANNAKGEQVETNLLIIYLSDEEDCSNNNSINENVNGNTRLCYTHQELLTETDHYVQFFRDLKTNPNRVWLAMFAGLFDDGMGPNPDGCMLDDSGQIKNNCKLPQGNEQNSCTTCFNGEALCTCHPAIAAADCQGVEQSASNCCQADPAKRYFDVVTKMNTFKVDTICSQTYKDTLLNLGKSLGYYNR